MLNEEELDDIKIYQKFSKNCGAGHMDSLREVKELKIGNSLYTLQTRVLIHKPLWALEK